MRRSRDRRNASGSLAARTAALGAALVLALLACGRAEAKKDVAGAPDTTLLTAGAAAVAGRLGGDTAYPGIDYELTRERFDRWRAANESLRGVPAAPVGERLDVRNATDEEVDRVVDYFEDHDEARRAIEAAGLSPKDYVLTTLAVEQAALRERGARFGGAPEANVPFVAERRAHVDRARETTRSRFLAGDDAADDDSDDRDSVSDDDARSGNGKGKGRGKGRGKGHDKKHDRKHR